MNRRYRVQYVLDVDDEFTWNDDLQFLTSCLPKDIDENYYKVSTIKQETIVEKAGEDGGWERIWPA